MTDRLIQNHVDTLVLKDGLVLPFLPAASLLKLAEVDFSGGPVAQTFPTTAVGLASALGDAAATPSYIWTCDETSGNLVDKIASEPLVPTSSPLQNRSATGLPDSKKCVEFTGSIQAFDSDDASVMDVNSADFAVLVVFRTAQLQAAGNSLVGKRVNLSSAGWHLRLGASGSSVVFELHDGTNACSNSHGAGVTDDGAWHFVCAVYDHSAGQTRVYSDTRAATTASVASFNGNASNADFLQIGRINGWSVGRLQIAYLACFEGATACDALDQTALDNWWVHGSDPTSKLSTATRASAISYWSAAGEVAHHASGAVPVVYEPALGAGSGGHGILCNKATTNLVPYSEMSTGATEVTCSSSDQNADSPDGMRNATLLTASANGGYQEKVCVTVASTAYCGSVFIKESTVGVTGTVELYDLSNGATLGNTAFTATGTWQRVEIAASTIAGGISTGLRVTIDTNTETVLVYGAQLELGDAASHYVKTEGAAAATVASDFRYAACKYKPTVGEIQLTLVPLNGYQLGLPIRLSATTADRRDLQRATNGNANFVVHDDGGVTESNVVGTAAFTLGAEHVTRLVWDSVDGVADGAREAAAVIDGTTFNGQTFPWEGTATPGEKVETLGIGNATGGGNNFDGVIQYVRVYDGLTEALP